MQPASEGKMVAVKARFNGETIVVPKALRGAPASDVIILIPARKVAESTKAVTG
jgi:hypothetical protein